MDFAELSSHSDDWAAQIRIQLGHWDHLYEERGEDFSVFQGPGGALCQESPNIVMERVGRSQFALIIPLHMDYVRVTCVT